MHVLVARLTDCDSCGGSHEVVIYTARRPRLIRGVWHLYLYRCRRTGALVPMAIEEIDASLTE